MSRNNDSKPKKKAVEGNLKITFNSFGQVVFNKDYEDINEFLNQNVDDLKLQEREEKLRTEEE